MHMRLSPIYEKYQLGTQLESLSNNRRKAYLVQLLHVVDKEESDKGQACVDCMLLEPKQKGQRLYAKLS